MSAKSRSIRALSALNFCLADVRDGLGPFLGVFLIGQGWDAATIGLVTTIGGIAGMLATTPLGALADATRFKRAMVAICAVLTIIASLIILFVPTFTVVAASQVATAIAGAAIAPAIAALTLGIVGQSGLAHQLGRNEAWNHGGNGIAAALAGIFGYFYGLPAVFALMTVLAVLSLIALFRICPNDIDHDVARGLESGAGQSETPQRFRTLFTNPRLLVMAGTLLLFHLGNGAMLPLLGQHIATNGAVNSAAYTAITIIIAQVTMIPLALLASRIAGAKGYYYLFLAALIALPLRGLIAGTWGSLYSVVPVQMLDGVGAGLQGVAVPGMVALIMRGTGRVNVSLGAVATVQGIGASLSPALGGYIATAYGFPTAFLSLGAIAVPAVVMWLAFGPMMRPALAAERERETRRAEATQSA
nr:MFS transporter [Jiella flava]